MFESVADVYYARIGKSYLYNITAIENIPSIMRRGIICYDSARKLQHNSIAMNDVQARRALKGVPNGLRLHQYANLYFTYHNPMMYKRQNIAETICVLALSASVLDIEDCVVSDMNAAADLVRFYPAYEGIGVLDFLIKALAKEYEMVLCLGPATFIVGIVATLAVSLLVSFLISRKNKKIDMVEALKGTE